jgi:hypothetical protein
MTGSHPRSARDVVEELFRRQRAADDTVLDDLVATDMSSTTARTKRIRLRRRPAAWLERLAGVRWSFALRGCQSAAAQELPAHHD